MTPKSEGILKQWFAAINSHDVSALKELMAADPVFVDSPGDRVEGATSRKSGWRGISQSVPTTGFAEAVKRLERDLNAETEDD